jgi:hypothetical protein
MTDSRTALIEGYAGKAADLTRTVLTKGFVAADTAKAFFAKAKTTATTWWVTTKAKVQAARPAKEAPTA